MKSRVFDVIAKIDNKLFVQMLELNPVSGHAEIEFQHNPTGLRSIVFSANAIRVEVDINGPLFEAVEKHMLSQHNQYATMQMSEAELYNMIENNL